MLNRSNSGCNATHHPTVTLKRFPSKAQDLERAVSKELALMLLSRNKWVRFLQSTYDMLVDDMSMRCGINTKRE